jgi:muramoyltetrapeptide carboxypeptidase LdcA involved in peptidoglycan recycling
MVVSPSQSISTIEELNIKLALKKLESLGFKVRFSSNCFELDDFNSSSIKSRADDLHEAFKDKTVNAILCARGGFNSNQLLNHIDYKVIKNNPKIFCGYSDITALNNAIYAKVGLVTYAGINFSTFRKKKCQDYNIDYFKKCLMSNEPYKVLPSKEYYEYSSNNLFIIKGYFSIGEGEAKGEIYWRKPL